MTLMSSTMTLKIPDRWTFNAIRLPECKVTLCTWAMEADANGFGSNQANKFSTLSFNSNSTTSWAFFEGMGGTLSCNFSNSKVNSMGTKSERLLNIWPNLTKVGPSSSHTNLILAHLVYDRACFLEVCGISFWINVNCFLSSR